MSTAVKAVAGAIEIGGGIALMVFGGPVGVALGTMLLSSGIATEAGALAQALGSKAGLGITTRTPAASRQIIRGVQRVGGTIVYQSTTGGTLRQYNLVIVIAGDPVHGIENLYLDGRQVFWNNGSAYNQTVNGLNFGGDADGNDHTGPNGVQYNFGGKVFCAAFQGRQTSDPTVVSGSWVGPATITGLSPASYPGFASALEANDSAWAPSSQAVGAAAVVSSAIGSGGSITFNLESGGWGYPDGDYTLTVVDLVGSGSGAAGHIHCVGGSAVSVVTDSSGGSYVAPQATAPPGTTSTSIPYLGGCTYVYLKIEADLGTFPQFPEIKFTVHGKDDIYDPRTDTAGFTTNWALHVADVLMDPTWGLGDTSVNMDQLIAAANVCDEMVACAAGDEARYCMNWTCDASMSPGDQLSTMMRSKEGRLSRIGGEWYVWPAYWQGPSATFDENALLADIAWAAQRSLDQLCNRVTGKYIAPNFPFNVTGNLYDSNGFWNGQTQNNFPYGFQPTDYPEYAEDALHGFGEDVFLIADTPNLGAWSSATAYAAGAVVISGGTPWQATQASTNQTPSGASAYWKAAGNFLPFDLMQECTLSISEAQRVAKIHLLRNRQQGSGTLVMGLEAFQLQPLDVLEMNFAAWSWTNKLLEVAGAQGAKFKLRRAPSPGAQEGEGGEDTPALFVEVPVNETDSSVYEWDNLTEELTNYDVSPYGGAVNQWMVAPPTSVTATSNLSTALIQPDGSVIPRIELTWTEPADPFVTGGGSIRIQMTPHGTSAWEDVLLVGGTTTTAFLGNVISGSAYDLQIAAVRANGAQSAWVQVLNVVCGYALAASNLTPVAPAGTLNAVTSSAIDSDILIASPFTATFAGLSVSCTPSLTDIPSLTPQTLYSVYYIDTAFAGGSITPIATTNQNDFLNKPGYFLIGTILTPPWGSTRLAPSAWTFNGSGTVTNPANVYDGNVFSFASFQAAGTPAVPTALGGQLLYSGFPPINTTSGQQLKVFWSVTGSGIQPWIITASIGGGSQPAGPISALNDRSAWAASTAYAQWDKFSQGGVECLVVAPYTSGGTFGSTDMTNTCLLITSSFGTTSGGAVETTPLPTGLNMSLITVVFSSNGDPGAGINTFEPSEVYVQ